VRPFRSTTNWLARIHRTHGELDVAWARQTSAPVGFSRRDADFSVDWDVRRTSSSSSSSVADLLTGCGDVGRQVDNSVAAVCNSIYCRLLYVLRLCSVTNRRVRLFLR